jgi:hypothetical protein
VEFCSTRSFVNICDQCLDIEENNIKLINEYIKSYSKPFVPMTAISEETGIELREIEEYIKLVDLLLLPVEFP